MISTIKVNLEEIESMLYFWQASKDKEKVGEEFLNEVAKMAGLSACYDDEFNGESVRKVLSAITNRELLSNKTPKEARFWNNNMWMMDDLSYTDTMVKPLKMLNIDDIEKKFKNVDSKYENIEIRFAPLHMDEYIISKNMIVINFFKVKPSDTDETAYIDDKELKQYIEEKINELINKAAEGK